MSEETAGTQPDTGTSLALDRTYLASERTLMGWIRTALSMISFGFTLGKMGEVLKTVEVKGFLRGPRMVGVDSMAHGLVVLGIVGLAMATVQHVVRSREYRVKGLGRRFSVALLVAVLLILTGGFALFALVQEL